MTRMGVLGAMSVDRIRGGMMGLLVGDALGVPYEFHPPEAIPPVEQIDMEPPPGFQRAHRVPAGTWSDDGAQALCLAATLAWHGRFDGRDFANRLSNWANVGYLAVDGHVFDIGIQTQQALMNLAGCDDPLRAGPSGEHQNGNGSLMRALPLALWHGVVGDALWNDADAQSRITHGHPRARLCCVLLCFIACRLAEGLSFAQAWEAAALDVRAGIGARGAEEAQGLRDELSWILQARHEQRPQGSGYVLDSLWSTRACLIDDPDYETAVRRAIQLGNDTDTTACIVGGLAGLVHGEDGIPLRWRAALRGETLLRVELDAFLKAVSVHRPSLVP